MKKIKILMVVLATAILSGCANKPSQIERVSPCACYDIVQIG